MSVSSQTARTAVTITALPQTIPVFEFNVAADLIVYDGGASNTGNDPATVLTLGSDYTVSGGGYNAGNQLQTGNVVVNSGGAGNVQVGDVITVLRNIDPLQTTTFASTGLQTPLMIEADDDKSTTEFQQVLDRLNLALHFEPQETLSSLLLRSARASSLLGFDSTGAILYYNTATLLGVGLKAVPTYAALKALNVSGMANQTGIIVLGYYTPGDNGGGLFYYASASSATPDGGTVIAPNAGSGRFFRVWNGYSLSPDWFGALGDGSTDDYAAINSAIAVFSGGNGTVVFSARTYAIGTTLAVTQNNMTFVGAGMAKSLIQPKTASLDAITVGVLGGTVVNKFNMSLMGITRAVAPTTGKGLSLLNTALATISDVESIGHQYSFYMAKATNSYLVRCLAAASTATITYYGYAWDGGSVSLQPIASSKMTDCICDATANTGTSYGLKIFGMAIADFYCSYFASLRASYGIHIDGSLASAQTLPYNWDIQLDNPIVDEFTAHGIYITGNTKVGAVTIANGWTNPGASAGIGSALYVKDSRGVTSVGLQVTNIGQLATARGVTFDNSYDCNITKAQILDQDFGIYFLNAMNSVAEGNRVYNQSTLVGSTAILLFTGTRCQVLGNMVDGYNATGIYDDVGSSKNIVTSNMVIPPNIVTPISLNGTGDSSANNITT